MKPPFKPDRISESVQNISIKLLMSLEVEGIILDVDNTLLPRTSNNIDPKVVDWVKEIKKRFKVIIISNNSRKKIERVAIPLELPYISWAVKPFRIYYRMAEKKLKLKPKSICMIGDQLFTDIKGAKKSGMKAIWVKPISPEKDLFWTKSKRKREAYWISKWNYNLFL
ncbi:MAG: YqeG family HAD IIIA-type phosphatase [Caldisericia bacterium]|nr:YqeG family HAD IIIA-type phosphatase [Caldisericia bacterium]